MPKPHEHKLDIVCLQCVINLKKNYNKMLYLLREIAKDDYHESAFSLHLRVNKLLNEIGEE